MVILFLVVVGCWQWCWQSADGCVGFVVVVVIVCLWWRSCSGSCACGDGVDCALVMMVFEWRCWLCSGGSVICGLVVV
jgi:hypothetical protein